MHLSLTVQLDEFPHTISPMKQEPRSINRKLSALEKGSHASFQALTSQIPKSEIHPDF